MTMKKPTFCMFISAVAMASVLLVSCSLGDWNNGDELNNVTMTLSGDFAEHDGHLNITIER